MAIRKKLSKRFNKPTTTLSGSQPPIPTLPSNVRRTSFMSISLIANIQPLPTFHSGLPLLEPSPRFTATTNRAINQSHRRSRSFSALTPPSRDFASSPNRDSSFSRSSQYSGVSVDQPWRSQDTWRALHAPPSVPRGEGYGGLTHPSALPSGSGGWRSRAGEGFFAMGNKTPKARRKTLEGEEEDIGSKQDGTMGGVLLWEKEEGVRHMVHPGTPATSSPLSQSTTARPPLPADFAPRFELNNNHNHHQAHTDLTELVPTSRHQRNESLLPPLLPTTVIRPHRSSSFTSLRNVRDSPSVQSSPGLASSPLAPIPWGRRTPAERRSASPTLSKTPIKPRSIRRAPQKALPVPPEEDTPMSPDLGRYSGLSLVEEGVYVENGDGEGDRSGSVSPVRERLATPVTPPQMAVGGRDHLGVVLPKRWDSLGRTGASREASWEALNSNQSRASRGGWI